MTDSITATSRSNLFQAPWPKAIDPDNETSFNKILSVAGSVLSYVIFPIAIAKKARSFLHRQATPLIHPAARALSPEEKKELGKMRRVLAKKGGQQVSFKTPDGIKLGGMFFEGRHKKKVILYCGGNAAFYEATDYLRRLTKKTGASLLLFNPRGVNPKSNRKSEGFSNPEGLSLDFYTAFKYLVEVKKIKPNRVLPYGMSLGSAIANCGAALVQKEYPDKKIMAISDRSFATLSQAAQAVTENVMQDFECCSWQLIAKISGFVVSLMIKIIGWQMDSRKAWEELKGRKCVIFHKDDPLIPLKDSLYQGIKDTNQGKVNRIKLLDKSEKKLKNTFRSHHVRAFFPEEEEAVGYMIQKMLNINPQTFIPNIHLLKTLKVG